MVNLGDITDKGGDLIDQGKDQVEDKVNDAKDQVQGAVAGLIADNIDDLIKKIISSDWCQKFADKFLKAYIDKHAAWLPLVIAILGFFVILGAFFSVYLIYALVRQCVKHGQCCCCICRKSKLDKEVAESPKDHGLHLGGRWDWEWMRSVLQGIRASANMVGEAVRQSGALERTAEAAAAVRKQASEMGSKVSHMGEQRSRRS